MAFSVIRAERYRANHPQLPKTKLGDNFGWFVMPTKVGGPTIRMMVNPAFEEFEFEHVSVSLAHRTPTWAEMCRVKDLFWGEEDCVIQYHPPKSQYIDMMPFCLHLWCWKKGTFPMPNKIEVGL